MRFDRRAVPGSPDGSFIGAEIEVMTVTGSVQCSVTQPDGDFELPQGRIWGYPVSPQQMTKAVGFGKWQSAIYGGWLFDQGAEYFPYTTASYYRLANGTYTKYLQGFNEWVDTSAGAIVGGWGANGPMGVQPWADTGTPPGIPWYGDRSIDIRGPGPVLSQFLDAFPFTGSDTTMTGSNHSLLAAFVIKVRPQDAPGAIWTKGYGSPNTFALTYQSGSTANSMLHWAMHADNGAYRASASASIRPNEWTVAMIALNRESSTPKLTVGTIPLFGGSPNVQTVTAYTGTLTLAGDTHYLPPQNYLFNGYTGAMIASASIAAMYVGYGYGICGATESLSTGEDSSLFSTGSPQYSINTNMETALANLAESIRTTSKARKQGSTVIDNSITSFGTALESQYLNQKLLGLGTGALGRSAGLTSITTGSIPSWTNVHIRNSAFVMTPLSSSDHESQILGYWKSGSSPLETTAVPASASMYYSKHGRYQHVIVKKTASINDLQRLPAGMDGFTPVSFVAGKGTDVSSVTGTLAYYPASQYAIQGSLPYFPCLIPIDVPYSGKIADIKVWIELVQVSGSGASDSVKGRYPLGNLTIGLRSPNVRGFHAHPIRNDVRLKKVFTSDLSDFTAWSAIGTLARSFFGPDYVSPIYRDTFLLWEGPTLIGENTVGPWDTDIDSSGNSQFATKKYPSWQRDRGMRTVFSDGAAIPNPRHHIGASPSLNYNGSPNAGAGFANANGFDVPWTSETEISGANTYAAAGSPPKGWLSGPGGTNAANEWATTGSNYGAAQIRPFYPLLDELYQRKRYGDIITRAGGGNAVFAPDTWVGYRPGLRGTEASGTWYLAIATGGDKITYSAPYTPTYFRQVRIEFLLESGSYTDTTTRHTSRLTPRKSSKPVLALSVSGTDAIYGGTGSWEAHTSDTYLFTDTLGVQSEIGRTFGVAIGTGSINYNDYALIYQITGTLADISGSAPGWLTNNRFGMPVIPLSSASLVENTIEPIVGITPQDLLTVRPVYDGAQRLSDAAVDATPIMTRAELAATLSGTLI